MFQKQKEIILSLVKTAYENKNFTHHYLLSYKDFLDIEDDFTDFQGERKDGKAQYISLLEQITNKDKNAQIFVEIYGFEEHNEDIWIYADTFIIFTELSFTEIQQLLEMSKDVFPSEIGEEKDITEGYTIIDKEGVGHSVKELCNRAFHVYYCWWD